GDLGRMVKRTFVLAGQCRGAWAGRTWHLHCKSQVVQCAFSWQRLQRVRDNKRMLELRHGASGPNLERNGRRCATWHIGRLELDFLELERQPHTAKRTWWNKD